MKKIKKWFLNKINKFLSSDKHKNIIKKDKKKKMKKLHLKNSKK